MNVSTPAQTSTGNRYAHRALVGKGAFGEVYASTDSVLGRPVALKLYYPTHVEAVRSAIGLWSRLNHPHIAQIIDYFETSDSLCLVMTYCEKGTLDQQLVETSSSADKVVAWFKGIAEAVHWMHTQGLVVRDLKLSNVMIDGTDSPVLIDLDQCIQANCDEVTGQVGTLGYMAPELYQPGKAANHLTDQYALGMMLYQMLAATHGIEAKPSSITSPPRSSESMRLPQSVVQHRDWNAIIGKAMYPEPSGRYDNVADMVEDVKRLCSGLPIVARKTNRAERVVRWIRRYPRTAALSISFVVTLFLGLGVLANAWSQASFARSKVMNNTAMLNQRIAEANAQEAELTSLVAKIDAELKTAEAAENAQNQATVATLLSEKNSQREAQESTRLTAELNELVRQATETAQKVKQAETENQKSRNLLESKRREEEINAYAAQIAETWSEITVKDWEGARRRFSAIKDATGSFEYNLLANAIQNRLSAPVLLEIGKTTETIAAFELAETCDVVATLKGKRVTQINLSLRRTKETQATVTVSCSGVKVFEFQRPQIQDKIVSFSLLSDGSILFCSTGERLLLLTFATHKYKTNKNEVQPGSLTALISREDVQVVTKKFGVDPNEASSRAAAQQNALQEIAKWESALRGLPKDKFDYRIHNELRHYYLAVNESKSCEHLDIIFKNQPFDGYAIQCMAPLSSEKTDWVKKVTKLAQKYPKYKYLVATCWAIAAKKSNDPSAKERYSTAALSDSSLGPAFLQRAKEYMESAAPETKAAGR